MQNEKKTLSFKEVRLQALDIYRATRRPMLTVALLGLVVPQLVLSLIFDSWSKSVVADLRALFMALPQMEGGSAAETVSYHTLIAPALPYLAWFVPATFILCIIMLASYFALTELAVRQRRAMELPRAAKAFLIGLGLVLRRGLVLAALVLFFIAAGQVLIVPSVLLSALSLMVPVIVVAERQGIFRSLGLALTMRYTRRTAYTGWNVLFSLFMLAALFYAGLIVIFVASEHMLRIDLWSGLPRSFFLVTLPGTEFSPLYVIVAVFEVVTLAALIGVFPLLTTALYFIVVGKREITVA